MCARFRTAKDLEKIRQRFASAPLFNFEFNPNLAPSEKCPILRSSSDGPVWANARFGLIPFWTKTLKGLPSLHNARGETITEKPAFKQAYSKRRCIIPAEGFYEWREEDGKKQPYFFSRKDGKLVCFAGIWEFTELEGEKIFSFSIVTGEPSEIMRPYHDRMPLITDDVDKWLDLKQNSLKTVTPLHPEAFHIRPMNHAMNKASLKDLALIEA